MPTDGDQEDDSFEEWLTEESDVSFISHQDLCSRFPSSETPHKTREGYK